MIGGMERWKDISGYEGYYQVSDWGNVRSVDRVAANGAWWPGKLLKTPLRSGYPCVDLSRGTRMTVHVHVLVMLAFVGPRPEGMVICHFDGDPTNNHLANLRYDTHSSNMLDSVRHGTHPRNSRNRGITHCKRGHKFTPENTSINTRGARVCRKCAKIRMEKWLSRRSA